MSTREHPDISNVINFDLLINDVNKFTQSRYICVLDSFTDSFDTLPVLTVSPPLNVSDIFFYTLEKKRSISFSNKRDVYQ